MPIAQSDMHFETATSIVHRRKTSAFGTFSVDAFAGISQRDQPGDVFRRRGIVLALAAIVSRRARDSIQSLPRSALTRVAIPSTEARWLDIALGKNVRQIEELVAGRAPGDDPDDAAKPELRRHTLTLDVSAETFARWRQTRTAACEEHGRHLDDDAFANDLLEARLDRGDGGEPSGRAKFQILMTLCTSCKQGWQEGSGVQVPVDAPAIERAECDAQYIGSTSDDMPVRAAQDIPPSVVRFVWRRDGGRCQTPGCRSARGLEVHHIVRRADGGGHEPSNLRLQCSACHAALHRGTLAIDGDHVTRPNEPTRSTFDAAANRAQARDALVGLGWKTGVARAAVDEAISHVGDDAPLEKLIFEALRRCPRTG